MRLRWIIGISVVVLVTVALTWLSVREAREICVSTTSAAFVRQSGSPLFEATPHEMRVLMGITPAKEPEEAGVIYDAAKRGVPVVVTVPYRDGVLTFQITGLNASGDLIAPCKSKRECAAILEANRFKVPDELQRLE